MVGRCSLWQPSKSKPLTFAQARSETRLQDSKKRLPPQEAVGWSKGERKGKGSEGKRDREEGEEEEVGVEGENGYMAKERRISDEGAKGQGSCPSSLQHQLPVGATGAICQKTDCLEEDESTLRRDEKRRSIIDECVLPSHGLAEDDLVVLKEGKREEQATTSFDRRSLMAMAVSGGLGVVLGATLDAMTTGTALATPLETPSASGKRTHLPLEEIKSIIEHDMKEGRYLLTGDLTKDIYADDCRFEDPTNVIVGVDRYAETVKQQFDPAESIFEFKSIAVSGANTIDASWVLGGVMQLPWRPRMSPVNGVIRYTINNDGLVAVHTETWNASRLKVLQEMLTPSFGN
ncbi:hypothetical protein CBR_g23481 [Chara braunii]|uniref:Uncharacterized protein n=1 Tax=Chara braunii TaxID=69332 RepID=A0A388L4C3_CHABU|nr:hypothetical protein CBR_g23481 [Chara braunii]|eukprot:GBG77154.1 hypothetical protein CBR_g23481 [Chara braunii]